MPPPLTLPSSSGSGSRSSQVGPSQVVQVGQSVVSRDPPRSSTTTSTTHDSIVPEFNSTPVPQRDSQVQRDYDRSHHHHHHHRDGQFTPLPQINTRSNDSFGRSNGDQGFRRDGDQGFQQSHTRHHHHHNHGRSEYESRPVLDNHLNNNNHSTAQDPGGGGGGPTPSIANRANSPDFFSRDYQDRSRDQNRTQDRTSQWQSGVRGRSPRYQHAATPPPPQQPQQAQQQQQQQPTQQNPVGRSNSNHRTLEQVFHQHHHHHQQHHQNVQTYNQLQNTHEQQVIFYEYSGVLCLVLLFKSHFRLRLAITLN